MSDQESFDQREQCAVCERELIDTYHLANEAMICSECRMQLENEQEPEGSGMGRFSKALTFGVIGGAIGAGIYFAILKFTGYEVGLVAIVVGFLVGGGVRMGSLGRGGWLYQLLAIGITYGAIVSTYVPFIVEGIDDTVAQDAFALAEGFEVPRVEIKADHSVWLNGSEVTAAELESQLASVAEATPVVWYYREGHGSVDPPPVAEEVANAIEALDIERINFRDAEFTDPMGMSEAIAAADASTRMAAAGFVVVLAAVTPFLALPENLIGLAIIAFALYQAWSMNRREQLVFEGPLELSSSSD